MAKETQNYPRIGDLVPAESVAVPVFSIKDVVGKTYYLLRFELKLGNEGGEYALLECQDVVTNSRCEITSWDTAVKAQLANLPEGTPLPIVITIAKFGKFHKLT